MTSNDAPMDEVDAVKLLEGTPDDWHSTLADALRTIIADKERIAALERENAELIHDIRRAQQASSELATAIARKDAVLAEFWSSLEMLERHGPDLTCEDGEFIRASTLSDRADKLRAALSDQPIEQGVGG